MPEIDTLLQDEGHRWREHVDARLAQASLLTAGPRRRSRGRVLALTASLAGAVVVVGIVVAVAVRKSEPDQLALATPIHSASSFAPTGAGSGQIGMGSCAGPLLQADSQRTPAPRQSNLGTVSPGQTVTVYGWYYISVCNDVQAHGQSPGIAPLSAIRLLLTTSDGHTVTLDIVYPSGNLASFVATMTIPADAVLGPATIHDRFGHAVALVIAAG